VITYVDTSTLLKRLLTEAGSDEADAIWSSADVLASAVTVIVEARAALAAAHRAGRLTSAEHRDAKSELVELLDEITFVEISDPLVEVAADLAEAEALRGYDALHLAAALAVDASVLTSADVALCRAAARRGIHVANPLDT
jgi:predicted nucleic acid-binding protein